MDHLPASTNTVPSIRQPLFTRRRFFRAVLGFAAASTATSGYAFGVEPHWLTVRRHVMPVARLPHHWIGRTIAQITDIHAGPVVDTDYLRTAMCHVNALRPDLLLITGDFVTYGGPNPIPLAMSVLDELHRPPLGIWAVLGNHDYGDGWVSESVAEKLIAGLTRRNIRVLRNEVTVIDGLQLAGIDEIWARRTDVAGTLAQLNPDQPAITMVHNPDVCDDPHWGDYSGWILCGHTHGGQVDVPLLGPPILPIKNHRYARGTIALAGGRSLYVNTGVGYLHRVRFNCRPEIALFTLKQA